MTRMTRFFVLAVALATLLPTAATALDFDSDFTNYTSQWMLDSGSDATQNPSSLTLAAAAISPKERGRLMMRPILATTPEEILRLVFTVEASSVTAPFAARIFYYDASRNYLDSDPLFGTLSAGTIVTAGTVLTPHVNAAGIRVRLYSNAQTGSVTFESLRIETTSLPTPEPGTAVLMGLGLGGLALGGRRKKTQAA